MTFFEDLEKLPEQTINAISGAQLRELHGLDAKGFLPELSSLEGADRRATLTRYVDDLQDDIETFAPSGLSERDVRMLSSGAEMVVRILYKWAIAVDRYGSSDLPR